MRHFKQYFFFLFQIVSRISAKWQPFWKSLYHHCWPTPQFRRLGQVAESDGDDFLRSRETHPLFHWCQHNKGSWNEVSQVSQTRFMLKGLKYGEALCRRVGSAVVVVVWVATATGHWIPWIKHWRKSQKNHMFQKFSRVLCRIAVYGPWRSKSWSGVFPRFWCSGTLRLHGCGVPNHPDVAPPLHRRHVQAAQIIAGHGGPLQHFHGRFVFPWLSVSLSKSLSLRHDSKMTVSVMEMKCKRLMTGH